MVSNLECEFMLKVCNSIVSGAIVIGGKIGADMKLKLIEY